MDSSEVVRLIVEEGEARFSLGSAIRGKIAGEIVARVKELLKVRQY
jgi:hypothetical protein